MHVSIFEGYVFSFNLASKRVLEKAGFEEEGFLRKTRKSGGNFIDAYFLSKIK